MAWVAVFRPQLGSLVWLAAFSVAANLLALALPLHMMAVYDRVLPSGSVDTLVFITLIVVLALAVLGVAEGLRLMLCHRVAARLVRDHGGGLVRAAIEGEAPASPRELVALQQFVASRTFAALFDLPFVPLFAALMFLLHPLLGAVTVVVVLVLAALAWAHVVIAAGPARSFARSSAAWHAFGAGAAAERETALALGMRGHLAERWGHFARRALDASDGVARVAAVGLGITRAMRQIAQVAILSIGAWLVVVDQLSAGVIFGASILFGRAIAPAEQVIASLDRVLRAREDMEAVAALVERADEEDEREDARDIVVPLQPRGRVELVGISAAEGAGGGLSGVTLALEPAKIVAVIGPTGAGKSALASIVAGAVPPATGKVLLDGHDPAHWSDARRAAMVGYVPQDAPLFPGSIADNIARFAPRIDEDRVLWAARFAGAHDAVARLPEGYGTLVASDRDLTAGERQLVAFARALYARPRLLVLDEPNAYLDQHGEAHFLRALTNARHEGMGSLVVSQRRSILQVADYIATLENGRLRSFEANRGQWKRRAGDERRREAVHEDARQDALRANAAVALADQLSRSLGVDVRPS